MPELTPTPTPEPEPTPTPEPAPEPTSVVNADGTFAPDWYKKYDKSTHETLKRYAKHDDFVNSHMEQRKKLGEAGDKLGADPERVLIIPGDDASDEVKAAYYRKLGVPDELTGYEYTRDEDLSDKIVTSDEKMAAFSEIAKKYNLNPKQYNGIVNDYFKMLDKEMADLEITHAEDDRQTAEAGKATMKKLLGNAYDQRMARVNLVIENYARGEVKDAEGKVIGTVGDELDEAFPGLRHSPLMTMFIDSIAQDLSPDRLRMMTGATIATPGDIQTKLNDLRRQKGYFNRDHPDYKRLDAERQKLINQMTTTV